MDRTEEIRERAEAASDGPWLVRAEGVMSPTMSVWDDEPWKICHLGKTLDGPNGENAEFIAHSRSDIPYLLERVSQLERENERLGKIKSAVEKHLADTPTQKTRDLPLMVVLDDYRRGILDEIASESQKMGLYDD